jgi:NAD-dependent SIR2 family protein deacetylase
MFCDPLDLPDDVIAAQEAGELVIFAGAGVSLEHPSNIPLFKDLTDNIGAAFNKTRDPLRDDLDVLLGEWKDSHGARVHEAAYEIVSNPKSRPTEVHFNLLKLFKKPEHIRIVTTNYDRHFTTVGKRPTKHLLTSLSSRRPFKRLLPARPAAICSTPPA